MTLNECQSHIGPTMTLTFQVPWLMVVILCLICLMQRKKSYLSPHKRMAFREDGLGG